MRHFYLLLAAVVLAVALTLPTHAATVTISALPSITSPSTNTWIEVADMAATPKSRKYLLTNLATVAQVPTLPTNMVVSTGASTAGALATYSNTDGTNQQPSSVFVRNGYVIQTNDVTAFGAVGNGVADDTASVSNALKTATSIYFPPGSYLCSALAVTNATLFGVPGKSKLVYKNPTTNGAFITCGTGVILNGLWINGNTNYDFGTLVAPTYTTTGIVHYATGGARVENCIIDQFATGLYIDGPNDISARLGNAIYSGNMISNNSASLYLADNNAAEYILIQNNQVRRSLDAMLNYSAANITVVGNVFTDGYFGIYAKPASGRGHSLYSGNTVNHFTYLLHLEQLHDAHVIGNNFLGGTTIDFTTVTNCLFVGNTTEATTVNVSGSTNVFECNSFAGATAPTFTGATSANAKLIGNTYKGSPISLSGIGADADSFSAAALRGGDLNVTNTASANAGVFTNGITAGASTFTGNILFTEPIHTGGAITLASTNRFYLCNVDAQTITLPTAAGNSGKTYSIKLISPAATGTVTNSTGSQYIDGALSYSLTASNKFVRVTSDGTNWWIFGNN